MSGSPAGSSPTGSPNRRAHEQGLMRARVLVRPKQGILDPQGQAVERALPALGFNGVRRPYRSADRARRRGRGRAPGDVRAPAREPADRGLRDQYGQPAVGEDVEGGRAMKFGIVRFPGTCDDIDAQLAAGRSARRAAVARRARPPGGRRGDRPGRLLLRRLPAHRCDRPVRTRDGGSDGFRPRRRPRARDLQRLSDPVRGRPAAGGAAAEHLAAVRLPPGGRWRSSTPTRPSRAGARRADSCRSRSSTRPAATTRPSSARPGPRAAALRRRQNPNGSQDDIAGSLNDAGNVFGLMPHPEHAVDPLTGSTDGLTIFESMRAVRDAALRLAWA